MKSLAKKKRAAIPISTPPAHYLRWMLFVDGENFTLRAQELAKAAKITLTKSRYYEPDVYVWLPGCAAKSSMVPNAPISLQPTAIRAYYYTSAIGDENRINDLKKSLGS